METFTIYFEFSGHKFKHKVIAENKEKAKAKALGELASKINILKVKHELDEEIEFLKTIFNLE